MSLKAALVTALGSALALLAVLVPSTATAQISDAVTVTIEPATNNVVLGENFELRIDVSNTGTDPSPPLVIHIDITDPASRHSVDPEDWTSTLSKTLDVVAAGETRTVTWQLQPISPGTYSIYAVALSPGIANSTISNIATVDIADQRSLNPGGILPVAIATPTIIGALLALQTRRNRRTRRRSSS